MAWTAPRTWVVVETPTAAQMNTHVRDNELFLRAAHSVKLYSSLATISTPATATDYSVQFNSEAKDTDAFHSASFLTRIVVPTGFDGDFKVGGICEWAGNGTGSRSGRVRLNGVTDLGQTRMAAAPAGQTYVEVETLAVGLVAGDYLEFVVNQSSGGGLIVAGGTEADTQFWAYYLGS